MNAEEILKTKSKLSTEKKMIINLFLAGSKAESEIMTALKDFELSIQQFNVLRILRGQQDKPANLKTVQERMVHKMSNTTRLVDKLIAKKFVDRSICKANRRKVELFITEKGLSLLEKIDPVVIAVEKETTKNLNTKELEKLNELLEKLRA